MENHQLVSMVEAMQLAISLYCFNVLVLRQRNRQVYTPLALFFATNALLLLPSFISFVLPNEVVFRIIWLVSMFSAPFLFLQPFFFWLFVRQLSAEDGAGPIQKKYQHAIPQIAVLILILVFMVINPRFYIAEIEVISQWPKWVLYIAPLGIVMSLFYFVVVGVYLTLVVIMLRTYRTRVKDLFATTEGRELTWIGWIVFLAVVSLIWSLWNTSDQLLLELVSEIIDLLMVWVIGVWGSRLKPGLSSGQSRTLTEPVEKEVEKSSKYERSALGPERAARIASKIEAAMQQDKLYRDSSLSLWDLAQNVGVNSNHVSQTLNATLQKNFFDYVNGWRINEAATLLQTTSKSILEVTYEVGFNSRSSFYTAFKRELGTTPKMFCKESGKTSKTNP
jgi:AraC-like DNA-binding protein